MKQSQDNTKRYFYIKMRPLCHILTFSLLSACLNTPQIGVAPENNLDANQNVNINIDTQKEASELRALREEIAALKASGTNPEAIEKLEQKAESVEQSITDKTVAALEEKQKTADPEVKEEIQDAIDKAKESVPPVVLPSVIPTFTPQPVTSVSPSPSATVANISSPSATPATVTPTPTASVSSTPIATPTPTPSPTPTATPTPTPEPTPQSTPQPSGELFYSGSGSIYKFDFSTHTSTSLATGSRPVLSPDKTQILYLGPSGTNSFPRLFTMGLDGTNQLNQTLGSYKIFDGDGWHNFSWSPESFLYTQGLTASSSPTSWALFSHPVQLPQFSGVPKFPVWKSGREIFFLQDLGNGNGWISKYHRDTQAHVIPLISPTDARAFFFSPDNADILFTNEDQVYLYNMSSQSKIRLTNDNFIYIVRGFTPDGTKILCDSYRNGSWHVYLLNKDGSGGISLDSGAGSYLYPIVSPNGAWVIYYKSTEKSLYAIKIDGTHKQKLALGVEPDGSQMSWK